MPAPPTSGRALLYLRSVSQTYPSPRSELHCLEGFIVGLHRCAFRVVELDETPQTRSVNHVRVHHVVDCDVDTVVQLDSVAGGVEIEGPGGWIGLSGERRDVGCDAVDRVHNELVLQIAELRECSDAHCGRGYGERFGEV